MIRFFRTGLTFVYSVIQLIKKKIITLGLLAHTHSGILLSHKQGEIFPSATTWPNLEDIVLSEISQTKTNTR